jgi:hypothetical protein
MKTLQFDDEMMVLLYKAIHQGLTYGEGCQMIQKLALQQEKKDERPERTPVPPRKVNRNAN